MTWQFLGKLASLVVRETLRHSLNRYLVVYLTFHLNIPGLLVSVLLRLDLIFLIVLLLSLIILVPDLFPQKTLVLFCQV
jgi:hypothetical protein